MVWNSRSRERVEVSDVRAERTEGGDGLCVRGLDVCRSATQLFESGVGDVNVE